MRSLFSKPNIQEQKLESKRNMRIANRELASDRRELERKEKQLEDEIRKAAKAGQKETCALLAKQLVQLRKQKANSIAMSSKLSSIGAHTNQISSMEKMSQVMGRTVNVMKAMGTEMRTDQFLNNIREFKAAQGKLELSEEVMNSTLDDILDEFGDEDEQNLIVNQVLDEIGIETECKLAGVPKMPSAVEMSSKPMSDNEMERILVQLRK